MLAVFVALLVLGCVRIEAKSEQNVQLAPAQAAKLMQHVLQCISDSGVDPAIVVQIKDKKYGNDENIKKFFFCSFKKTGLSSKKGVIKVDKMLEIYPEKADKNALKKVIEECNADNGTEPIDKVFNFFKCFQEKTPVHITLMA